MRRHPDPVAPGVKTGGPGCRIKALPMATQPSPSKLELHAGVVAPLWRRAEAGRWALAEPDFGAALERSAVQRFRDHAPSERELEQYLDSLHLDDLALACA